MAWQQIFVAPNCKVRDHYFFEGLRVLGQFSKKIPAQQKRAREGEGTVRKEIEHVLSSI